MDLRKWSELCGLIILICSYGSVFCQHTCTPGLSMPGYTYPHGDIAIEYGDPLDIVCVVVNSTQHYYADIALSFKTNGEPISPEMINVINASAIQLHIGKPSLASGDTYTCLLNNVTSVCMNRVTVGVKPQNVSDFKCISMNYDNLTCTWTAPQNYIVTNYSLEYTLGAGRSARNIFQCPIQKGPDNKMSCFWNISTTPQYRQVHAKYIFRLRMENKFGNNSIEEEFNHFAHVLSGPPENLTALSTTPSSIYLSWVVPLSMQPFGPGVHHRILYQCEYGNKEWHFGGLIAAKSSNIRASFNLTNLQYAHALCDIRVSLRSAKALPLAEEMWSRNASITVRTGSTIPSATPNTTIGSFEIVPSSGANTVETLASHIPLRDVYVYWQQIPDELKNGPNFQYMIEIQGDEIRPTEIKDTYAKFSNLSIFKSYRFYVWCENSNGSSSQKSIIDVPKKDDQIEEPRSFTKVELSDGEYELSWEKPNLKDGQVVTNYTIFSCIYERERPYQCNGYLNWTVVTNDTSSLKMQLSSSKMFQFAISANSETSTSGMLWAACTIIHNKNVGKMKNVWINSIGSTYLEVGWKLDCSDRVGSVEGYVVYYCPIKSPRDSTCKAQPQNITFEGGTISGGNVTSLTPYTTYMLTVSVKTKRTSFSQQSDPVYNTTLEAAPNSPPHVKVDNIGNTSIAISWTLPKQTNGKVKFYKVVYSSEHQPLKEKEISSGTNFTMQDLYSFENYTIQDLDSFENYTIRVATCTVQCSEEAILNVSTRMSYPNKIWKPTVDRNDTCISISWNKPTRPGGNNDYYVVRLKQILKSGNRTLEYNTTSLNYVIDNCGDGGKYNTFYISVRTVNINKTSHQIYEGPWSDELEHYCYTPINYIMYLLLFIVIAALGCIGFLFTRLYHRCKIMRDVEVKLPPGLAPVVADQTLVPWSTQKSQEGRASYPSPSPDEELLLMKMNENVNVNSRQFSGDSSGCSSGHESVTSSVDSQTHISSSSDSGTEQPMNYSALSVNGKSEDGGGAYLTLTTELGKQPLYEDSCHQVGTVANDDSSSYVVTGETVKSVNPGYIPFNRYVTTVEPNENSINYVVVGGV